MLFAAKNHTKASFYTLASYSGSSYRIYTTRKCFQTNILQAVNCTVKSSGNTITD